MSGPTGNAGAIARGQLSAKQNNVFADFMPTAHTNNTNITLT